jgi:hypothetical protein
MDCHTNYVSSETTALLSVTMEGAGDQGLESGQPKGLKTGIGPRS